MTEIKYTTILKQDGKIVQLKSGNRLSESELMDMLQEKWEAEGKPAPIHLGKDGLEIEFTIDEIIL